MCESASRFAGEGALGVAVNDCARQGSISTNRGVWGPLSREALADSHISEPFERIDAVFCGLEGFPPVEHDERTWFAVVACPTAEPCANPGGVGERSFGMR